ncbi:pilus assembly protein PilX [Geobacter sp. DSM 9736]|uniref:pilus assembly protein PilX n=1 Tax=Geobacter sp. DSM 9736 TaxID=1277350 RepID=UPI000B50006F|nr:pilus assembly protein PilX [Geobacter sp. DSM 9736]SNB46194.1 hypothetical protein SAMN06269301_1638 [Geobacter sp. DSM 9736]
MRTLRNEDGIAMVTALMLTMLALAITMSLLYLVTVKTRMSGAEKRYKSSFEASYAAATNLYPKDILPTLVMNFGTYTSATAAVTRISSTFSNIDLNVTAPNLCLKQKVTTDSAGWTACNAASRAGGIDPKLAPDMTFRLRGDTTGFNLYAKIVNNVPGMSDSSGLDLEAGGGVASVNNNPSVMQQPTLYTFEVQGEREGASAEKAIFEVLYAY